MTIHRCHMMHSKDGHSLEKSLFRVQFASCELGVEIQEKSVPQLSQFKQLSEQHQHHPEVMPGNARHCPQCTCITRKWLRHVTNMLPSLLGNTKCTKGSANVTHKTWNLRSNCMSSGVLEGVQEEDNVRKQRLTSYWCLGLHPSLEHTECCKEVLHLLQVFNVILPRLTTCHHWTPTHFVIKSVSLSHQGWWGPDNSSLSHTLSVYKCLFIIKFQAISLQWRLHLKFFFWSTVETF